MSEKVALATSAYLLKKLLLQRTNHNRPDLLSYESNLEQSIQEWTK